MTSRKKALIEFSGRGSCDTWRLALLNKSVADPVYKSKLQGEKKKGTSQLFLYTARIAHGALLMYPPGILLPSRSLGSVYILIRACQISPARSMSRKNFFFFGKFLYV